MAVFGSSTCSRWIQRRDKQIASSFSLGDPARGPFHFAKCRHFTRGNSSGTSHSQGASIKGRAALHFSISEATPEHFQRQKGIGSDQGRLFFPTSDVFIDP